MIKPRQTLMRVIRGHGGFFHYSVKGVFVPLGFVGPSVCSPTQFCCSFWFIIILLLPKKKNHFISRGFLWDGIRLPTILFPCFILLVFKTILENKDWMHMHASARTRRSVSVDVKIWMFGLWSAMDGEILNKT